MIYKQVVLNHAVTYSRRVPSTPTQSQSFPPTPTHSYLLQSTPIHSHSLSSSFRPINRADINPLIQIFPKMVTILKQTAS